MVIHQGPIFLPSTSTHLWTQLYVRAGVTASLWATRKAGLSQMSVPARPRCRCWTPPLCAGRTCAAPPAARGSGRTAWSHTGMGNTWKRVPWTNQDTKTERHSLLLEENAKFWHIHGYTNLLKHQVSPKPSQWPKGTKLRVVCDSSAHGASLWCYFPSRVRFFWVLRLEVVSGSICSNVNICIPFSSKGPRSLELFVPSLSRNWNANFTVVKFTLTIPVQL